MFTKRNIAIYFGLLLALTSLCVSTAAADEVKLGLSVSPENLVIGTNCKWISVVFHVEGTSYVAEDIDPTSIALEIKDNSNPVRVNYIGTEQYDRTEITDADGDGTNELVLIYDAKKLLLTDFTYDGSGLKFDASGTVGSDPFTAGCTAKTTTIKSGSKGGEGRPTDPRKGR
jgi:hypothetical protein